MQKININTWIVIILVGIVGILLLFPKEEIIISNGSQNLSDALSKIASNVDTVSDHLSIISARLDNIEYKLSDKEKIAANVNNSNIDRPSPPSKMEKDSIHHSKLDIQQYNTLKSSIYGKLDNPSENLASITESSEMKSLPQEMQNEVMEEIVRRFNSGEINKYQFIPGYKE